MALFCRWINKCWVVLPHHPTLFLSTGSLWTSSHIYNHHPIFSSELIGPKVDTSLKLGQSDALSSVTRREWSVSLLVSSVKVEIWELGSALLSPAYGGEGVGQGEGLRYKWDVWKGWTVFFKEGMRGGLRDLKPSRPQPQHFAETWLFGPLMPSAMSLQ